MSDHNRQRSSAVGVTASVALGDAVTTALSYTGEASRNNDGLRGHMIRLIAEFSLQRRSAAYWRWQRNL